MVEAAVAGHLVKRRRSKYYICSHESHTKTEEEHLLGLEDNQGVMKSNPKEMEQIICSYFDDLFRSRGTQYLEEVIGTVQPRLDPNQLNFHHLTALSPARRSKQLYFRWIQPKRQDQLE